MAQLLLLTWYFVNQALSFHYLMSLPVFTTKSSVSSGKRNGDIWTLRKHDH